MKMRDCLSGNGLKVKFLFFLCSWWYTFLTNIGQEFLDLFLLLLLFERDLCILFLEVLRRFAGAFIDNISFTSIGIFDGSKTCLLLRLSKILIIYGYTNGCVTHCHVHKHRPEIL